MPPAIVTLAIAAAFLSGAVIAAFVMLVAGIHAGDHRHLAAAPDGQLEALTRTMLGVGVRTDPQASHSDGEKN